MIAMDWRRGWSLAALVGVTEALVVAAGLSAQAPTTPPARPDRESRAASRECECVDQQGNRSDRCFCFMMPDVRMGWSMGMARRAVLGVNVQSDQPARYDTLGARLYGVDEQGPAGLAGLEEGDILVRVDGQNLLEPLSNQRAEDRLSRDGSPPVERLLSVLADHEAGDTVAVEYLRDDDRRTASLVMQAPRGVVRIGGRNGLSLGPLDSIPPLGSVFGPGGRGVAFDGLRDDACPGGTGRGDRTDPANRGRVVVLNFGRSCVVGVELLEMQPSLAEYFGARDGGVLVSDAVEDNPLGLRAGDVLLSVEGREVSSVDRALRLLRSYDGDETVKLEVLRKQQKVELEGKVK